MDLGDLRSFIQGQKARLKQEKSELSRRRSPVHVEGPPPPEQDFRVPGSLAEKRNGSYSTDAVDVSNVSDVFCERINNLTAFKNQLGFQSEHKYAADRTPDISLPDNRTQLNGEANEEAASPSQQITPLASPILNLPPKEDEFQNGIDETKDINIRGFQRDTETYQGKNYQSPFPSREEEVERLQNRLSSAPFWDGFGRSATAKKWSPNALETMVRVGEFSPANPDLQAPGKALLGLGEYEDRRRQLLEKKKQEYKDYLSQSRNRLQRTDHLEHPSGKSGYEDSSPFPYLSSNPENPVKLRNAVDAATQTDHWLIEQTQTEAPGHVSQSTLSVGDPSLQPLSPRVPRTHSSQTTEQLPDARLRQVQLQEELRLQIEEKRRLEAERREQERKEEEALQRRVAEQQARLQAEYERDEKLRREREIQKEQQIEDFKQRQEELRAESEALKLEERRRKVEAADQYCQKQVHLRHSSDVAREAKNAHLVPPSEPAPVSILKSSSPPLRNPRRVVGNSKRLDRPPSPPSPRALIKVLEGPTLPKQNFRLEDSLPIPLMPVAHPHSSSLPPHRPSRRSPYVSPHRSPHISPHRSPHHSPSRFVTEPIPVHSELPHRHENSASRKPSEAMRNLEERWKVPAVQKNVCMRGKPNVQDGTGNVLTQLGAFRRQLQMEHMRMEEKVRERHQPRPYQQKKYQQNIQPTHYN